MAFITHLGHPAVTLSAGGFVLLIGGALSNLYIACAGIVVWLTIGTGAVLKFVLHRQRPLTEYVLHRRMTTHSFPSGHTTGGTVVYGLFAWLAMRYLLEPWSSILVIILAILVITIGISRIYLGAHFPSDVVAGWLLGGVGLVLIIFVIQP